MKQGHLLAVYVLLFFVCFTMVHIERVKYDAVVREKERIETALKKSIDAATEQFIAVQYEDECKKQVLLQAFFDSLYVYMGIDTDSEAQETIRMHIPLIALAEADGVYFYYAKGKEVGGRYYIQYEWEEKIKYGNQPGASVEKQRVAEILENKASEIISAHNYIAYQFGIEYQFFVPEFLDNSVLELEFPMIFVVFQGWPLSVSGDVTYDNCIDAGASVRRTEKYIVEVPDSLEKTYSYYHLPDCENLGKNGRIIQGKLFSKQEAVEEYGAVKCNLCGK